MQRGGCRQQCFIAEMTRAIRRAQSIDKSGANPRQHIVAAMMYITSSIYSAVCAIGNAARRQEVGGYVMAGQSKRVARQRQQY